jgi:hypothetical protein
MSQSFDVDVCEAISPKFPSLAMLLLQVPVRPTHLLKNEVVVDPSRTYDEFAEITPSPTPVFVSEVDASASTEVPTSQVCTCHNNHTFWFFNLFFPL